MILDDSPDDLMGEEDEIDIWFILDRSEGTDPILLRVMDGGPEPTMAWVH